MGLRDHDSQPPTSTTGGLDQQQNMAASKDRAQEEFTSFYLQQATKEFAEDLDKVRTADDFKGDALPMLIKALQQGTALFSPADQKRITGTRKGDDGSQDEAIRNGSNGSDGEN